MSYRYSVPAPPVSFYRVDFRKLNFPKSPLIKKGSHASQGLASAVSNENCDARSVRRVHIVREVCRLYAHVYAPRRPLCSRVPDDVQFGKKKWVHKLSGMIAFPHGSRPQTPCTVRNQHLNRAEVSRPTERTEREVVRFSCPQLLRSCEGCWWSTVLLMISGTRSARTVHVE